MLRCAFYEVLFFLIPLNIWRDFLIKKHFEGCRRCRLKLASREETLAYMIRPEEAESLFDFNANPPDFTERKKKDRLSSVGFLRRFGWAAAGLTAAAALLFFLIFPGITPRTEEEKENGRFQLLSLKVDERPAQAYLYRPQGTELVIIWAE